MKVTVKIVRAPKSRVRLERVAKAWLERNALCASPYLSAHMALGPGRHTGARGWPIVASRHGASATVRFARLVLPTDLPLVSRVVEST